MVCCRSPVHYWWYPDGGDGRTEYVMIHCSVKGVVYGAAMHMSFHFIFLRVVLGEYILSR